MITSSPTPGVPPPQPDHVAAALQFPEAADVQVSA